MIGLNTAERQQLLAFVSTGRGTAAKLLRARLLLKADVDAGGRCWTDAEMAEAVYSSAAIVQRVRQAWGEVGMETALCRKRLAGRQSHQLDGVQEAQLVGPLS